MFPQSSFSVSQCRIDYKTPNPVLGIQSTKQCLNQFIFSYTHLDLFYPAMTGMMFIKTIITLYLAAIALAAPPPPGTSGANSCPCPSSTSLNNPTLGLIDPTALEVGGVSSNRTN